MMILPADLHFRQKWRFVWRRLAGLPRQGLGLLDAGCGDGRWSIEIARRRPAWRITGVDRDVAMIARAEARRVEDDVSNVEFVAGDFFSFSPVRPFDVVMAICSTHYGTPGDTERLFSRIAGWLRPPGRVVLLLPRCRAETPFLSSLKRPSWHDDFTAATLARLCSGARLKIDRLDSCIGRAGALAKQLDWSRDRLVEPVRSAVRVVAEGLSAVDATLPGPRDRSLMWLLTAHLER